MISFILKGGSEGSEPGSGGFWRLNVQFFAIFVLGFFLPNDFSVSGDCFL